MSKSKKSAKKPAAVVAPTAKPTPEATGPAPKPIVRAIRVTSEVLAAAKASRRSPASASIGSGKSPSPRC
jgi:hypothetical protein